MAKKPQELLAQNRAKHLIAEKIKRKRLYIPYLIVLIVFCLVYSGLNWLLVIRLQLISVTEDTIHYAFPLLMAWIPMLLYLRPKLKILILKDNVLDWTIPYIKNIKILTSKGSVIDWTIPYIVAMWLSLCIPTIYAQSCLEKVVGELVELDNIDSISQYEPVKYYTIKHFYLDKSNTGSMFSSQISGNKGRVNNEHIDMQLRITIPILSSKDDIINEPCKGLIGITYSETVDLSGHKDKKEEESKFMQRCQVKFEETDFDQFVYLDRIAYNHERDAYEKASASSKYNCKDAVIFTAVNESFTNRYAPTLFRSLVALGVFALIGFILISIPKVDEKVLAQYESGTP